MHPLGGVLAVFILRPPLSFLARPALVDLGGVEPVAAEGLQGGLAGLLEAVAGQAAIGGIPLHAHVEPVVGAIDLQTLGAGDRVMAGDVEATIRVPVAQELHTAPAAGVPAGEAAEGVGERGADDLA